MADVVNGQSTGYDKLDKLKEIHSTLLNELKREIEDTKGMVGDGKGFHVEETSKKIITLLEALETQILPTIEQSFRTTEKSVLSMERMLIENDKF